MTSRVIAILSLLLVGSPAFGGTLQEVTGFGSNPGALGMFKYLPERLRQSPALVVALHGCTQSAGSYDEESGWAKFAERWGFALLLPEQREANNQRRCFNWFEPGDHARGQGEALSIKQMIDKMKADHGVDPKRVFVTGLSGGGAMAAVMLATYPEIFAGGGIVAGIPYKCAVNAGEALGSCGIDISPLKLFLPPTRNLSPQEWGNRVRAASNHGGPWPRVSIWQGDADRTVNPDNARELVEQWIDVHGIDQVPEVEDTVKGYPHRVYKKDPGGRALVELYRITGMDHGVPVDPGAAEDQCGSTQPFIIDANICASYHIARFWGLDDQESPRVAITAPADGARVSGVVTIRADATDDVGVSRVEFLVDGRLRRSDTAAPWEAGWDTTIECNGDHVLLAKALDGAGNVGTSRPVSVRGGAIDDRDAPTISLTSPRDGETVQGTITLSANANDNCGVRRVDFFVDNSLIGSAETAAEGAPWHLQWNTTTVPDGSHRLSVKASDAAGNASDDDATLIVDQKLAALDETFSDRDRNRDMFDRPGWQPGGWRANADDHTGAGSHSAFGYASSGTFCAIGNRVRSLTTTVALGANPKLSYFRKLDLRAAINLFTSASFRVVVGGQVVDEEAVIGNNYAETQWTERANLDLSAFANRTVTLAFEVAASSNVCLEAYGKAWIDDVRIGQRHGS